MPRRKPEPPSDDLDLGPARWMVLASRAYQAYGVSTGGLNFRGEPMPAFDHLPREIRDAWVAACREAVSGHVLIKEGLTRKG